MAIDGYIIQLDYTTVKEQTAKIQKVGVNVNRIAKRVKRFKGISEAFYVAGREIITARKRDSNRPQEQKKPPGEDLNLQTFLHTLLEQSPGE